MSPDPRTEASPRTLTQLCHSVRLSHRPARGRGAERVSRPYAPEAPEGGQAAATPRCSRARPVCRSVPTPIPLSLQHPPQDVHNGVRHPFWFSASPTLGSRFGLRLLRVLEGWRCVRAPGRPRSPPSHPRREEAQMPLRRPEKSKRAPLEPSRVRPGGQATPPTVPAKSAGRETGSGKGQGASGRAHARRAKGPVFQHGANSASCLLTLPCWSAPKCRPISAQPAARLRCGPRPRPAWPRFHRPRLLGALAGPGPAHPNGEEAGSSQLPPLDCPAPFSPSSVPFPSFPVSA